MFLVMREIKFRSWNKEDNVFYYFYKGLVFDCESKIKDFNHIGGNNFNRFNWDNAQQYTGLKDKNGNDIYEEDKLGGDEQGEYYLIEWNNEESKFQVNLYGYNIYLNEGGGEEYDNEISCIDTDCFELSALTELEIIGNIHESEVNNG